jgi:hypothetical protein
VTAASRWRRVSGFDERWNQLFELRYASGKVRADGQEKGYVIGTGGQVLAHFCGDGRRVGVDGCGHSDDQKLVRS